ncbi:hypothetical protein F4815DRAFT_56215 [Daldinia loculata]|uniref:uncharacterized protein n=1 Tax=Daldinia loculata TaxID=103429 RepID=UPI0020C343E4|nr:uncharacterized protein F4817DRAFT_342303 [Daldinia loculata]KAI1645801.1 hypothetical protein F4817DRAFT_342303 [Daldinia loculata]KAI2782229.1 hypothetical protein F4815DRAFT_56215 [Daldinia loculata]
MLKRMNLPRKTRTATSTPTPVPLIVTISRCPPLPLEIWTEVMRILVHGEDLPELWAGLRLLSHTLKAALETAFVDEHLSRLRGWLYVGDPNPLVPRRSWGGSGNNIKRIISLPLVLARLSSDRQRAYFVSLLHRDDPTLEMSPLFAECGDDTVVAEWLRSAHGIPPPGGRATEARLRLTIGPDCEWTHWKHHVIDSDRFVVESQKIILEDTYERESKDGGGNERRGRGKKKGKPAHAIGLEVDRTKCEISFEWTTLISSLFARPRRTFGEALRS